MIQSARIVKRLVALFLIVLITIDSFAAIIGDTDGSAFVTKEEFETLKRDFEKQIDNYNYSIDNKIDGGIADYLRGININAYQEIDALLPESATDYVISFNEDNPLDYKFGWPRISVDFTHARWPFGSGSTGVVMVDAEPVDISDDTKINKTVITNLEINQATNKAIAAFEGYRVDCDDLIVLYNNSYDFSNTTDSAANSVGGINITKQTGGIDQMHIENANIVGAEIATFRTSNGTNISQGTSPLLQKGIVEAIQHDWGNNKYPNAICWKPYSYDMFSNKDRDYNLGYTGSYMSSFDGVENTSWTSQSQSIESWFSHTSKSPTLRWQYSTKNYAQSGEKNIVWTSNIINYAGDATGTLHVPMIGFETSYFDNWAQIYLRDTSSIAAWDGLQYNNEIDGSIITTEAGEKFLSLSAGLPICRLESTQDLSSLSVEFEDKSKNYIIWVNERPFSSIKEPWESDDLVSLTKLAYNLQYKGYEVQNGKGTFGYENVRETEKQLYLKWGILNADDTVTCGGAVKVGKTYTVLNS